MSSGREVGSLAGGVAGIALTPYLGPFGPMVGSAAGGMLGGALFDDQGNQTQMQGFGGSIFPNLPPVSQPKGGSILSKDDKSASPELAEILRNSGMAPLPMPPPMVQTPPFFGLGMPPSQLPYDPSMLGGNYVGRF